MSKIAVFGVGYVGCVSGACLARDGHQVIGVDIDVGKVEMLSEGTSPVAEAGLDELIRNQVAAGQLSATNDYQCAVDETDIAMITVGTPSERDGSVEAALGEQLFRFAETEAETMIEPDGVTDNFKGKTKTAVAG